MAASAVLGAATLGTMVLGDASQPVGPSLGNIGLDDQMTWPDEDDWTPVRERVRPSVTGKPIVTYATLKYGRPITCAGHGGTGMFLTRATVVQLKALRDTAGYRGLLTLTDSRQYGVRWRHADGAIDVDPLPLYSDPQPTDLLRVILRFMEIPLI